MADRRSTTRRLFIALAILAALLPIYIGSFFLIRWLQPGFLVGPTGNVPIRSYQTLYLPLRWLVAERPPFLRWYRSTATVRATFGAHPSPARGRLYGMLATIDGRSCSIAIDPAIIDPATVPEGQTRTIQVSSRMMLRGGPFNDMVMPCIEHVDP